MHLLATKRFSRLRASRLLAAIFAIGWLGIVAAPCQALSHDVSMPAGDCSHCPGAPSGINGGCATAAGPGCAMAGPALPGYRAADLPQPAAGPPPAIPDFDTFVPDAGRSRDPRVRHFPVPHASIQQRYCTYLN